jgi:hypothetical protein
MSAPRRFTGSRRFIYKHARVSRRRHARSQSNLQEPARPRELERPVSAERRADRSITIRSGRDRTLIVARTWACNQPRCASRARSGRSDEQIDPNQPPQEET